MKKKTLYLQIAKILEDQINNAVFGPGDKLPSLRLLSTERGVSVNTVLQSYFELERRGLIESRPKSGYYVMGSPRLKEDRPVTSQPVELGQAETCASTFYNTLQKNLSCTTVPLSSALLSPALLPVAHMSKAVQYALRDLPAGGLSYDRSSGHHLKEKIAQRSLLWGGNLCAEEIITTAGCTEATSLILQTLLKKGDTIAVESPIYSGILRQAQILGLKVREMPTDKATGIDVAELEKSLAKKEIDLCLLVPNFSNPLGSLMPDANKKIIVRLGEQFNVPIVELDLFGDLYFGAHRPTCCKTYDRTGNVILCGSFSKTLAPGYRVGWLAAGKYTEQICKRRYYHSLYSATITHEAVAQFIDKFRYENYLRQLRVKLRSNSEHFRETIIKYFPPSVKVTRPQGGMHLWIELDAGCSAIDLYNQAISHKISISPGRGYTLQNQYTNCFKLCFGLPWNPNVENALKLLGKFAFKQVQVADY